MQRSNLRVILAADHPQSRHLLSGILQQEGGAVIVGQAENAARALSLTRQLRPDLVLIDCHLPHSVGLSTVPLSRISGLDTAQTISEEIPNVRVILLNNLETAVLPDNGIITDIASVLATDRMGISTPLTLHDLFQETAPPSALVFANIETKPEASLRWRFGNLDAREAVFVGLGVLGAASLMVTLALTEAWGFLAVTGAATIGIGLGLFWNRTRANKTRPQKV